MVSSFLSHSVDVPGGSLCGCIFFYLLFPNIIKWSCALFYLFTISVLKPHQTCLCPIALCISVPALTCWDSHTFCSAQLCCHWGRKFFLKELVWSLGSQGLTLHFTPSSCGQTLGSTYPNEGELSTLTGMSTCRYPSGGEMMDWSWIWNVLDSLDALALGWAVSVLVPTFQGDNPFLLGSKTHTPFRFSPILPSWYTVVYVSWLIDKATQAPAGTEKRHIPSLWLRPPYTHHLYSNSFGGFPPSSTSSLMTQS